MDSPKNVLGTPLESCCRFPMTGFYRDGFCRTGKDDAGQHTVCIRVTADFLKFSKLAGNDLSTPYPEMDFPGLMEGDQWCLCALRWKEAYDNGAAPDVVLESTEASTLNIVSLSSLQEHAVKSSQSF